MFPEGYESEIFESLKFAAKIGVNQEIYRPGTALSHASNLCTAVGGDQKKEFRGNASFLREKGPRGGIKIYCYCIFQIDQRAKNHMYLL